MKSQTLLLVGGAIVLFYLYQKSQAATQAAQLQASQTNNYIQDGVGAIEDFF